MLTSVRWWPDSRVVRSFPPELACHFLVPFPSLFLGWIWGVIQIEDTYNLYVRIAHLGPFQETFISAVLYGLHAVSVP